MRSPGLTLLAALLISGAGARAAGAREAPVALVVKADSEAFSVERVRRAVSEAVGLPVVPSDTVAPGEARGTLTITWRPSRRELAVTYRDADRGLVSRVVAAPAEVDAAIASASALAANLVRDDAEELLGPRPPPPTAAPAPAIIAAAPPPPPTPTATPPAAATISAAGEPPRPYALATASLFFPLASNFDEPDVRTRLSVNVFHGIVGQLDGLQAGLGANVVEGPVRGAQLAGLLNIAGGPVRGIQGAVGFNMASGPMRGVQLALLGMNRASGTMSGLQAALAINTAGAALTGAQLSLGLNVAGDVQGLQFGLVNVAGKVRGVQLGLLNIADDVEGVPIGLVSVTRSGGVHPVFWSSTSAVANVGIKFSTRYTYSLFSGSARREAGGSLYGPGLALGVRIPVAPAFFETDAGASWLFGGPLCCVSETEALLDDIFLARLRALVGVALHRRFSLFVGTGVVATTRFLEDPGPVPRSRASTSVGAELFGGIQL